jgi:hypothetical protein
LQKIVKASPDNSARDAAGDVARAIVNVIDRENAAHSEELVAKGAIVAQRYPYEAILPKWAAFLNSGNG